MSEYYGRKLKFSRMRKKYAEKGNRIPLADYLKCQGRFEHTIDEDVKEIERGIDEEWKHLFRLSAN